MKRRVKPEKMTWQLRVRQVEIYHQSRSRENEAHRIQDTAEELKRSLGSVCQDLMLSLWIKSYPKLEKFELMKDALEFIREKKLERKQGLG